MVYNKGVNAGKEGCTIFDILSSVLKYVFIVLIYLFIYWIIRLIYLDIKKTYRFYAEVQNMEHRTQKPLLKLLNRSTRAAGKMANFYQVNANTTVGRLPHNNIVIPDSFVSSKHARFLERNGLYFIEDLQSTNGTFINGEKVDGITLLRNGDQISIGPVNFLFTTEEGHT